MRPRSLRPSCKRHNAIRASLVATFDDRQKRAPRIVAPRNLRFECLVRVGIESGDAPIPFLKLRNQLRQLPVARRTANQAYPRRAFEYLFAFLLRQTSQHTDDLTVFLPRSILAEPRKHLLRCLFAN